MAKPNGQLNGHGNGHDDGKVASLEDARRRAAQKAKAEQRAARGRGSNTLRDWIVGLLIVAMAIGYVASLFAGNSGGGSVAPVARENPEAGK